MLSKEYLKQVLTEQRATILGKSPGVRRAVLETVKKKLESPHVIVLSGLRRSGKSTLMRQVIQDCCNDRDFYYVTFEDERLIGFDAARFNDIYEALLELFGKQKTFFIDEIQNVDRFEAFVRRFHDAGFKFVISGSNARLLSKEFGTKLTGRHLDIVVKPFSFQEFLSLKGFCFEKSMQYKSECRASLKKLFQEYLEKGGMPEYLTFGDPEMLTRVYDDIVIKDIAVRHKIENVAQLRELYKYLITNFSNKFSMNSLRRLLNFGSMNTVKSYISYLEEAYFVKTVYKFDYSMKKRLVNDKKLYVVDNAFVPLLSTRTTKDRGWMLENLVFSQLSENSEIFYYSNCGECDFVSVKNGAIQLAVQVCWELTEANKERELSGLTACMAELKVKNGLLLTYDQEDELAIGGKKITVMPAWKWLLQ